MGNYNKGFWLIPGHQQGVRCKSKIPDFERGRRIVDPAMRGDDSLMVDQGLTVRLDEIDPKKTTVVYCAIGGRSRVAAQIPAGKGFKDVYNLSGGMKAWNGETALFDEQKDLDLFS